jgi:hypothetical protein
MADCKVGRIERLLVTRCFAYDDTEESTRQSAGPTISYLDRSVDNHGWCSFELSGLPRDESGLGLRNKSGDSGRQEEQDNS